MFNLYKMEQLQYKGLQERESYTEAIIQELGIFWLHEQASNLGLLNRLMSLLYFFLLLLLFKDYVSADWRQMY